MRTSSGWSPRFQVRRKSTRFQPSSRPGILLSMPVTVVDMSPIMVAPFKVKSGWWNFHSALAVGDRQKFAVVSIARPQGVHAGPFGAAFSYLHLLVHGLHCLAPV